MWHRLLTPWEGGSSEAGTLLVAALIAGVVIGILLFVVDRARVRVLVL